MSELTDPTDAAATQSSKKGKLLPILLGLVGAASLGGGAFYAVYTGLVLSPNPDQPTAPAHVVKDFSFVPIDVITISLPPQSGARFLRFAGQIEVADSSLETMMHMQPRFIDLINTYLHAVDIDDLREPAALIRLRAQILRRLQMIAGDGHVRDFLITEFILD
ncbi:flagellar basal body-associated FliL family protein [Roseinatronobacter bogoriensis]|uniref:Flagellar protein FliL n=1 Tax=Roseinatronobacter bogoriensis subsp. barguzinensis TaxID=441209 RepID=A0A2K8KG96_9RHOB|nr:MULTISPECIES: flagellar basal body-associated FliL family protein [Rhodobaca]ATX66775.1 flagellar basal body protein FliL [Rhodobaca barguzinensis]MBB4206237.1 flagellar FliL protein [Rhodobaca bogoriensis DSM 18756]TDW40982.1 flagellar FliL protein [Rhodobaca barguzinensis]TDY74840.1 flagellar FliL protein [Rhodobaca bogoriensis DSM 18756]